MQVHIHPRSGEKIEGVRLGPGSALKPDDKYDSSSGNWDSLPDASGLVIQPGCATIWVRQPGPLSDEARSLLKLFGLFGKDRFGCIGAWGHGLYIIPSSTFNWDGRVNWMQLSVAQVYVQELVDFGYLAPDTVAVSNPHSDHAMVGMEEFNHVFVLTDEGKDAVRKAH